MTSQDLYALPAGQQRIAVMPVGQQRIAVMPVGNIYPTPEISADWLDSLVMEPGAVEPARIKHPYEIVAESGPFRLRRVTHRGRYRQGV